MCITPPPMTYLARVGGRLQLHVYNVYMSKFYVVGENWGKGGGVPYT